MWTSPTKCPCRKLCRRHDGSFRVSQACRTPHSRSAKRGREPPARPGRRAACNIALESGAELTPQALTYASSQGLTHQEQQPVEVLARDPATCRTCHRGPPPAPTICRTCHRVYRANLPNVQSDFQARKSCQV